MGHVLPGSRENYFSRNNPEEIAEEYMKIDFSREIPETKVQKQTQEIERLKMETEKLRAQLAKNVDLIETVQELSRELKTLKREVKSLKS